MKEYAIKVQGERSNSLLAYFDKNDDLQPLNHTADAQSQVVGLSVTSTIVGYTWSSLFPIK